MVILITGDNLKANKQLAAILAASFAGDSFILTDLTVTPWLGASLDCIDWQTAESSQIILISTTADTQNPAFNPIHIDKHYFIVRCDGKNIYTVYQFDGFQPDYENPARLAYAEKCRFYPVFFDNVQARFKGDNYYKKVRLFKIIAFFVFIFSMTFLTWHMYPFIGHSPTVLPVYLFYPLFASVFALLVLVHLNAFNRSVE